MSDFDVNEFDDLLETGYETKEPVAPEEEFFHSVYIAGQTRKNHIGVMEQAGKLQVRGVEYNLDKVHMVITHVKSVLSKISRGPTGKETVECFSFQSGDPPWYGSADGRKCGTNSAERAASDFCNPCRSQLIVTGLYCDQNGRPILGQDKKPVFVFIRGKGMKYSPVAEYVNALQNEDFEPVISPVTEKSRKLEKVHVNNKRFVTVIGIGSKDSKWGSKLVFELSRGTKLPPNIVLEVLKVQKKTLEKFNEKFDWSKAKQVSGYGEAAKSVDPKVATFDAPQTTPPQEKPKEPEKVTEPSTPAFSFDDIDF